MLENFDYNYAKAFLFGLGTVVTGITTVVDDPNVVRPEETRSKVTASLTFLVVACVMLYSWVKNDWTLKSIKDAHEENNQLHGKVSDKISSQSACSNLTVPMLKDIDTSTRFFPSLRDLKKPNYMMNREVIISALIFWFLDFILNKLLGEANNLNYVAGSLLLLFAATHIFSAHYLREQVELLSEEKESLLQLEREANVLIQNGLTADLAAVKAELASEKATLASERATLVNVKLEVSTVQSTLFSTQQQVKNLSDQLQAAHKERAQLETELNEVADGLDGMVSQMKRIYSS